VVASAVVALVGECDQPGGGQFAEDAPDPGCGQVMDGTGRGPETQRISPSGAEMTCRFMPVAAVLAGVERPVGGDAVDGD
jgi:hypothetical protein